MTRTPEVTESWVDWSGQQSLVLTLDKTPIKDPLEPPLNQNVIVIIPGNPGLGTMYTDFMKTLSDNLDCDTLLIHAFSYLGHETHQPSYLPTAPTYTLEDQIEHKIALLEKLIPRNAQLTLIGHSIGCKICMEIFRRNSTHAIKDVFFLFPTIENMVTTVRGQQTLPWVTTFRLLALVLITVISFLPDFLLKTILKLRYRKASPTFLSSVLNFVNSNHLNNCLMLAKNELETVLDLDVDTIKQMVGKLHIYFGNNDGWSPLAYRDNLLQNIPEIARGDAVIDTLDIPHAFVEFHSEVTANIVADWIKRLEGDKD